MLTPATAPPAPAPPKPTAPAPRYAAPDPAALVARGDAMLELGDVSAARLLYERAAALGNAKAATAAGKTYDPAFLTSIRASGLVPDRATAAAWYQKGVALGDREAADRLAKLSASR
jgi:TPR repeat protein